MDGDSQDRAATAVFAAGCFWGPEQAFADVEGVVGTEVGYTGGNKKDPSYEEVCSGQTGHAEAVRVRFDPDKVSFAQLVECFFDMHDPTTKDRQGPDVGSQYRSAVFVQDDEQKKVVEGAIRRLQDRGRFSDDIVTRVEPAGVFYRAEEYHQRYLARTRLGSRFA